jgi:hypothetical protein
MGIYDISHLAHRFSLIIMRMMFCDLAITLARCSYLLEQDYRP